MPGISINALWQVSVGLPPDEGFAPRRRLAPGIAQFKRPHIFSWNLRMMNRTSIPNPALQPLAALIGDWHSFFMLYSMNEASRGNTTSASPLGVIANQPALPRG